MRTLNKTEKRHVDAVWDYYKTNRRVLPWRETNDVYAILISEMMLQQTQVSRVLIKYAEFLSHFPTIKSLAESSMLDVLKVWKGLGYNRRAFFLKRIAEQVIKMNIDIQDIKTFDYDAMLALPGVGQSTAGAVMTFAHNIPQPFIETNIRTVYISHFFKHKAQVTDKEVLDKVSRILAHIPKGMYKDWYYALYDLGTHIKQSKTHATKLHRKSAQYNTQSKFEGSTRQLRSHILHTISDSGTHGINKKNLYSHALSFAEQHKTNGAASISSKSGLKKYYTGLTADILDRMTKEGQIRYDQENQIYCIHVEKRSN